MVVSCILFLWVVTLRVRISYGCVMYIISMGCDTARAHIIWLCHVYYFYGLCHCACAYHMVVSCILFLWVVTLRVRISYGCVMYIISMGCVTARAHIEELSCGLVDKTTDSHV